MFCDIMDRNYTMPLTLHQFRTALAGIAISIPALVASQEVSECLVQASEVAQVGAAGRGVVAQVHVDRADRVTRDQVLVELEASEEDMQVDLARLRVGSDVAVRLARARAETAELNAERLTTLVKRKLVPKSEQEAAALEARSARLEEEDALYQMEVAEVQLQAALAARERKRVRAPFDGVVTDRAISAGELYNEQGTIVTVARIDPLHVDAYLPASRRAELAVGQTATVTLETGGTHEGVVRVIDPVLDAVTGTFGVRLDLANPDGAILAGQSCFLDLAVGN